MIIKKALLILLSFISLIDISAQQLLGGEIFYQHVDSSKYTVDVKLYRACNDSAFWPVISTTISATGFGMKSVSLSRVSINDNSAFCKDSSSPCSPANMLSGPRGMEIHHYQTNIDLADSTFGGWIDSGACKFYFQYKGYYRKGNYLYTLNSAPLVLFSLLDVCMLKQCKETINNSIVFSAPPNTYLNVNNSYALNMGGVNLDSDSMIYTPYCTIPPGTYGNPCTTSLGGSLFLTDYCLPGTSPPCTPIPSASPAIGTFHNKTNGDLVFTPTVKGEQGELFIKANDYRKDTNSNHVLIGYAMRSSTFIVDSFAKNNPPKLLGPYAYSVCEGEELCLNIKTKDAAVTGSSPESTYLSWSENLEGATFKYVDSTAREKTGKLCWTPAIGQGRSLPYYFNFTATDRACPRPESTTRGYSITVKKKTRIDSLVIKHQSCSKVVCEGFGKAVQGVPIYKWNVLDLNDSTLFSSSSKKDSFIFGPNGGTFVFQFEINNSASCPAKKRDTVIVASSLKMVDLSALNRCYGDGPINGFPNHGPVQNYPKTINQVGPVTYGYSPLGGYTLVEDTLTPFRTYAYRAQQILVFAKDSLGCINTDTSELHTHFTHLANLGSDQRICDGDTANLLVPNFAHLNYSWSNGDTTSNLMNITKTGLYTVTITDSNQCNDPWYDLDVGSIAVNEPVNANAGNDTSICKGSSVKLEAGESLSSSLTYFYTWFSLPENKIVGTAKNYNFVLDTAQSFALLLQQKQGRLICADRDTINIGVIHADDVNLLESKAYCYSDSIVYLDSLSMPFVSKTNFYLIAFNDSTNGATFLNAKSLLEDSTLLNIKNAPGRYLIQGNNTITSCLSKDTTLVIVNSEPKVVKKHKDTLCQSRVIGLNIYSTPTLTSGDIGSNWFGNGVVNNRIEMPLLYDSSIHQLYQGPHTVYGNYKDPKTGCSSLDSIELYLQQNPQILLQHKDPQVVCNGSVLDISLEKRYTKSKVQSRALGDGAIAGEDTLFRYYHGDNDAVNGFGEMYFYIPANSTEKCVADTQFLKVKIRAKPSVIFQVLDISQDSVSFNNSSSSFASGYYILNFKDTLVAQRGIQRIGNLAKGPNQAQLWVLDSNGCEDSTSLAFLNLTNLELLKEYGIQIPSLWDSKSLEFSIRNLSDLSSLKMEVFSIAGKLVYKTENLNVSWKNKPASGIYVVLLRATLNNGKVISVSSKLQVE